MAHILIMPRQGNTVESCIITDWKVKEGDAVTAETTVCEVETDKASFEVPAGAGGTVLKLLYSSGDDVPVLKPIAVIGVAGENWSDVLTPAADTLQVAAPITQEAILKGSSPVIEPKTPPCEIPPEISSGISPRAKNLAAKEALPLEKVRPSGPFADRKDIMGASAPGVVPGTGPGGRIIERDVEAALRNRPALTAAAKAAEPADVPAIGSGIGGRVTLADLKAPVVISSPVTDSKVSDSFTDTPIRGIRKIIAERMYKSLAESAQFTLNASAPAAKLLAFRSTVKAEAGIAEEYGLSKITINDLILFAASRTIPRFPFMNAHKIGDTIRTYERLHLAVAVDTPRGLMVPVIRNADQLSLARISAEAKRLGAACQNGAANPDELSGSTFTVSNLGSFGITSFTPVINAPEVAILGVCGIENKPCAVSSDNCGIRLEPHIGFSLTINHEAVDGAPAARFLQALCTAVAHIDLLLAAG